MPLRFAVILAGCGNKDGAEIHESVLTLLAIDKAGHTYQCFAPDIDQARVLNFITNEELKEKRNVMVEAARIARSNIKPLSTFQAKEFDILIIPGGTGVAHNLCSYAKDGVNMSINPDVSHAVTSMFQAKKPIGALCIAPVILGKLLPGITITFGQDQKANLAFHSLGVFTEDRGAQDIVIDAKNRLVTTPCYMVQAKISDISIGIERCVLALANMARD